MHCGRGGGGGLWEGEGRTVGREGRVSWEGGVVMRFKSTASTKEPGVLAGLHRLLVYLEHNNGNP